MRFPFLPTSAFLLALALLPSRAAEPIPAAGPLQVADGVPDPSLIHFTPPAPPPPAPDIEVEARSVLQAGSHRLDLLRGAPSELPDLPEPVAAEARIGLPSLSEHPTTATVTLGLSVVIYDHQLSHLRWRDPRNGEVFEAWCAWDWELVSPIGQLTGDRFDCIILSTPEIVITTHPGRPQAAIPSHPQLAPGTFQLVSGSADSPLGAAFLEAYRRHLSANRPQLEAVLAARRQAAADAAAWREANPGTVRDSTVWLRPHRGSRYLKAAGTTGERKEAGK